MVGHCENMEMLTAWVTKKVKSNQKMVIALKTTLVTIMVKNQWLRVTDFGFLMLGGCCSIGQSNNQPNDGVSGGGFIGDET